MAPATVDISKNQTTKSPTTAFLPGQIITLEVWDFMFFELAKFEFGPVMNLIYGPNDLHRSSVMSALYLGLGGHHPDRSLRDFIKDSLPKFTIEIKMKNSNHKSDVLIRRTSGRVAPYTLWKIDGEISDIITVHDLMASFRIKSSEILNFALNNRLDEILELLFSPKQLLSLTEETLYKSDAFQYHQALIGLECHKRDVFRRINTSKELVKVQRLATEKARLVPDLLVAKEKLLFAAEIKLLENEGELRRVNAQINIRLPRWHVLANDMVKRISLSFRRCLTNVGVDGKIELKLPADLRELRMDVYMKSSNSSPFRILHRQNHSGGEQWVALAFFLMSLHNLTTSPIRIFDGLDEGLGLRWEKRIQETCVDHVTSNEKIQCFYTSSALYLDHPKPTKSLALIYVPLGEPPLVDRLGDDSV